MTREEQWKDVIGYEGLYEISNIGRVRSLDRIVIKERGPVKIKGRMMSAYIHPSGYVHVGLSKNGKKTSLKVHRLVAIHFVPGYDPLKWVNHIDEDKANPCFDNLKWVTPQENALHSMEARKKNAIFGSKNHVSKIVLNLNTGIFYECAREAAYIAGMNYSTFKGMLNGDRKNKTPFIYA